MGKQFMIDHAHSVFRESASEPGEGGMIGSGIIKGEPQEFLEGDSIIDLGFQFGVGIDLKPLLEQEAFHEDQRRIGFIALGTFADGIVFHEQIIDTGPIHDCVDLLHSFDGPVLFDGRKKREIGKGEIGFHFLEAHSSSREMNLKEVWHKNGETASIINVLTSHDSSFQRMLYA